MRILHISNGGLPDPRIEKIALTMKKEKNATTIFLGGGPLKWQTEDAFDEVHYLGIPSSFRYVLDPRVGSQWRERILSLKPDIVHAHNVIVARFLLDMDLPTIYDDHEYWSKRLFKYDSWSPIRKMQAKPMIRNIPIWERKLLERFPCITTNETIANDHKEHCSNVFVVRNYLSRRQVDFLENPSDRNGIVYIGNDFELPKMQYHRNLEGLKDILEFDIITGLPHPEMMEKLTHYKLGHSAFRSVPFHRYIDANKNYEYLHAGLPVLISKIWGESLPIKKYIHLFEDYDEIPEVVSNIEYPNPVDVMKYARSNFLWEFQEDKILKAYVVALK